MAWDADSNRVSFTSSTGGTTQFVYDITAGIPAVIKEIGPSTTAYYVREPDGSLIAMFVVSYPYYYHFDALGSTRMLTDETGHITDTYSYDAWGNASHTSGSTEQPYQYVGRLGYYTHYQDANLPLLQLGVRFYDPGAGRFTQVDTVQTDEISAYLYAEARPTFLVDPSGMLPGRYQTLCGKICSKKGKAAEQACKQCKKRVDLVCAKHPNVCLLSDKTWCTRQCAENEKYGKVDYFDCICECERKYEEHMADGKAFE